MSLCYEAIWKPIRKVYVIKPLEAHATRTPGSTLLTKEQMCTNPTGSNECRLYTHLFCAQKELLCSYCMTPEEKNKGQAGKLSDTLLFVLIGIGFAAITGIWPF